MNERASGGNRARRADTKLYVGEDSCHHRSGCVSSWVSSWIKCLEGNCTGPAEMDVMIGGSFL